MGGEMWVMYCINAYYVYVATLCISLRIQLAREPVLPSRYWPPFPTLCSSKDK